MAARRVAQEFVKLWEGDTDCALPQRVTSVTRQGVTYTVLDSQDFLEEMRLGIYEVDLFLKTNNPNRAQKRSKVFSPDIPKARRYTPKTEVYASTPELDIVATKSGAIKTILLSYLEAEFLYSQAGWVPELLLRSYDRTRAITVSDVDITSTDAVLNITYDQAFAALKLTDPGSWDLYATKDNETVHIASGNLKIDITAQ
jgi:hypothetical protein